MYCQRKKIEGTDPKTIKLHTLPDEWSDSAVCVLTHLE